MQGQTNRLTGRIAAQLLVHDIHVNGLKAVIYCYGLSASRYIEYAGALAFLLPETRQDNVVLEVGCGHSILPVLWQSLNLETITLDANRDALKWQMRKSKKITNVFFHVVLADMRYMPFKNEAISRVSCISAIEHIPGDGDIKATSEIGRILKSNGVCIISIPLSSRGKSYSKTQWTTGIPPALQRLFKFCLPTILCKFGVDRTSSYYERFFSNEDARKRIIKGSRCLKEDYITLRSGHIIKFVHRKIVPTGVLTLPEYLIAKCLTISKRTKKADAVILKLRKRGSKRGNSASCHRQLKAEKHSTVAQLFISGIAI